MARLSVWGVGEERRLDPATLLPPTPPSATLFPLSCSGQDFLFLDAMTPSGRYEVNCFLCNKQTCMGRGVGGGGWGCRHEQADYAYPETSATAELSSKCYVVYVLYIHRHPHTCTLCTQTHRHMHTQRGTPFDMLYFQSWAMLLIFYLFKQLQTGWTGQNCTHIHTHTYR